MLEMKLSANHNVHSGLSLCNQSVSFDDPRSGHFMVVELVEMIASKNVTPPCGLIVGACHLLWFHPCTPCEVQASNLCPQVCDSMSGGKIASKQTLLCGLRELITHCPALSNQNLRIIALCIIDQSCSTKQDP